MGWRNSGALANRQLSRPVRGSVQWSAGDPSPVHSQPLSVVRGGEVAVGMDNPRYRPHWALPR
jgi:hypothetical protein